MLLKPAEARRRKSSLRCGPRQRLLWADGHTVWESILSSPLVRAVPQTERHPIKKNFLAAWTDARTQSPDFDPQPVIVGLATRRHIEVLPP